MNYDTFELIKQYLLGRLSEADARQVEERAETDAAFARELELQRAILKGIEMAGDEGIRAKIAAVDRSLEEKGFFKSKNSASRTSRVFMHPFHWAAAAAILLLLGAGLWWAVRQPPAAEQPFATTVPSPSPDSSVRQIQPAPYPAEAPPEPRPEQKPRSNAKPDAQYIALAREAWSTPEFSEFRSTTPSNATALSKAQAAFEKKKFNTVIQLLEPLVQGDPNYWAASELYAHACFLSGKTARAAQRFQEIAESGQLPFSERAAWYLLLCRLAQLPEGKAEFDALLNQILADVGHPYVEDARKIALKIQ